MNTGKSTMVELTTGGRLSGIFAADDPYALAGNARGVESFRDRLNRDGDSVETGSYLKLPLKRNGCR